MNLQQFDKETVAFIYRVIDKFQHFEFSPDARDWKWLKISGICFDTPEYDYFVLPLHKGKFHVQVCPIGKPTCYKFGIWFDREGEKLETQAYGNGHLW